MEIQNKNVLVTGTSSGIGEAICLKLANAGCKIGLIARNKEKLDVLSEKIGKLGSESLVIQCDVSKKDECIKAHQTFKNKFGNVDVAFLNAGIGSSSFAQNMDSMEIEEVMQTNFFGVVYFLEQLLIDMQKINQGTIVITSSLASYKGLPGGGSYSASKAALTTLIESYQIDLLATKIKLCLVSPYFVITGMSKTSSSGFPWTTSEKAADKIIKEVEKNKDHITFPWYFHLFMYVMKIMPSSLYRLFWKLMRRGG